MWTLPFVAAKDYSRYQMKTANSLGRQKEVVIVFKAKLGYFTEQDIRQKKPIWSALSNIIVWVTVF